MWARVATVAGCCSQQLYQAAHQSQGAGFVGQQPHGDARPPQPALSAARAAPGPKRCTRRRGPGWCGMERAGGRAPGARASAGDGVWMRALTRHRRVGSARRPRDPDRVVADRNAGAPRAASPVIAAQLRTWCGLGEGGGRDVTWCGVGEGGGRDVLGETHSRSRVWPCATASRAPDRNGSGLDRAVHVVGGASTGRQPVHRPSAEHGGPSVATRAEPPPEPAAAVVTMAAWPCLQWSPRRV